LPEGLDLGKLARSLNALTPPGIVVTRVAKTGREFDARADAVSRSYRYYLSTLPAAPPFWRPYCWALPVRVDIALLHAAAALISGRHDFIAFTPAQTEHVFFERTVLNCRWRSTRADLADRRGGRGRTAGEQGNEGMLYLEIEADAFLRHMVRTLVGTMVEVAQGKGSVDDFARLLEGGRRETAGLTAPAQGLFLWDISYAPRGGGRPRARMGW
jgi:tRNA pseudouridine38-40 synthase